MNRFPGNRRRQVGPGNSIYMEPSVLVPSMNTLALRLRERDQEEEEHRILGLTSTYWRGPSDSRRADEVGEFDLLHGGAEVLSKRRWKLPRIEEKTSFSLHRRVGIPPGKRSSPVNIKWQRISRAQDHRPEYGRKDGRP